LLIRLENTSLIARELLFDQRGQSTLLRHPRLRIILANDLVLQGVSQDECPTLFHSGFEKAPKWIHPPARIVVSPQQSGREMFLINLVRHLTWGVGNGASMLMWRRRFGWRI